MSKSALNQKIFISYARMDAEAAKRIYEDLTSLGADVWFDQESLRPGQKWKNTIKQEIKERRYFLAVMSQNSVNKRGYVQKEIVEALEILDEFPPSEIFIIPVRLDNCIPSHARLNDLHRIDMFPKWDDGIKKILSSIGIRSQDGESWNNKGIALTEQFKYDEALRCFDKALELNPQDARIWSRKGGVLYHMCKYDWAITAYKRATDLEPDCAVHCIHYAEAWYKKGLALLKGDGALQAYDSAIKLNPLFVEAWRDKGLAFYFSSKHDEALRCIGKALELNPQDAKAWDLKGDVFYIQEKYDEAILAYNRAAELDPSYAMDVNINAIKCKGMVLLEQGKYDEAILAFDKVIESNPNDPGVEWIWDKKRAALFHRGDYMGAIKTILYWWEW